MYCENQLAPRKYKFIYKVTNLINKKIYIGQHATDNIKDGYRGSGVALKNAFKKYGRSNFKYEILEFYNGNSKIEFDQLEHNYIRKYNSDDKEIGYNRTDCCGGGYLGEEIYKKRNYKHSEEAKVKISKVHKGKKKSPYQIEATRLGNIGKLNYHNETKEKPIEERKQIKISRKRERIVEQYTLDGQFIREWSSVVEAGRSLGLDKTASSIRIACNDWNKTSKGFKWKYKESSEERCNQFTSRYKRATECKYFKKGDKIIEQYDLEDNFIQTFDSYSSAAREVGVSSGYQIKMACDNFPNKTVRGFYWKRIK